MKKNLGQSFPAATVLTDAATVPAAKEWVVSTIIVTNQSATVTDGFKIAVAVAGTANVAKQYIAGGASTTAQLSARNFAEITVGLTLAATDVIRIYSENGTCSFNINGDESDV